MFYKLFSILLFVTICEIKCDDDLNKLGSFGYNMLDDLIAKYSRNDDGYLSNFNDRMIDSAKDEIEFKVLFKRFFRFIK